MKPLDSPISRGLCSRDMPSAYQRLSIVGAVLWFLKRPSKWRAYLDSLKDQLSERGALAGDVWPSDNQRQIAKRVEEILAEYCWGEYLQFHPDDPYYVIGEIEVGDLSEIEAVLEMERCFGIEFPDEWAQGEPVTFGDVVSYIEKNGEHCSAEGRGHTAPLRAGVTIKRNTD